MIVGAYPSAKFYTVNGIADTPLADNDSPFSNKSYFDGSRVRTIPSGKELNEVILEKIGVNLTDIHHIKFFMDSLISLIITVKNIISK